MTDIQVQKRDGSIEDFARTKVVGSLLLAGASPDQARSISGQIETWARTQSLEGKIKTSKIREKVLSLLRDDNPEAAKSYEGYKKVAY